MTTASASLFSNFSEYPSLRNQNVVHTPFPLLVSDKRGMAQSEILRQAGAVTEMLSGGGGVVLSLFLIRV